MDLYLSQYLGNLCGNPVYSPPITGDGIFEGSGNVVIDGYAQGTGIIYGTGVYVVIGDFNVSGVSSGYISGYQYDPYSFWINGDYITYQGTGSIKTDYLEFYSGGVFSGRNEFDVIGAISTYNGNTGIISGSGVFSGSGQLISFDGKVNISGGFWGNGLVSGNAEFESFWDESNICYGEQLYYSWDTLFEIKGDFILLFDLFDVGEYSWGYSGTGLYRQISSDYASGIYVEECCDWVGLYDCIDCVYEGEGYYTFTHGRYISGNGSFKYNGILSGEAYSVGFGYGVFTGENIIYKSGQFIPGVYQDVFILGKFGGSGEVEIKNGWYKGYGFADGSGFFSGSQNVSGLGGNENLITGRGYLTTYFGKGSVTRVDSNGNPLEIICASKMNDVFDKCGYFPDYLSNCSQIGEIRVDFDFSGDCFKHVR